MAKFNNCSHSINTGLGVTGHLETNGVGGCVQVQPQLHAILCERQALAQALGSVRDTHSQLAACPIIFSLSLFCQAWISGWPGPLPGLGSKQALISACILCVSGPGWSALLCAQHCGRADQEGRCGKLATEELSGRLAQCQASFPSCAGGHTNHAHSLCF